MNNSENIKLTLEMSGVEQLIDTNNRLAQLLKDEGLNFDEQTLWLILDLLLEATITEEIIEREYVHNMHINALFKKAVELGFLSPAHAAELWKLK